MILVALFSILGKRVCMERLWSLASQARLPFIETSARNEIANHVSLGRPMSHGSRIAYRDRPQLIGRNPVSAASLSHPEEVKCAEEPRERVQAAK